MSQRAKRLLILGGTAEARALADAAAERFGAKLAVTTALAGRTRAPLMPAGAVRIGGFGGADGLADYLRGEGIDALIDATHPFAQIISDNAHRAAEVTETPHAVLIRPPIDAGPHDRWTMVDDAAAAVSALPGAARRVFLTLGVSGIAAFAARADLWYLVRLVDPPAEPIALPNHTLVLGRGGADEAAERALLEEHAIDCVVTRESGGAVLERKLAAARACSAAVVMIRRPDPPAGIRVASVEAALAWLEDRLARS